jgi:hypothetical protein
MPCRRTTSARCATVAPMARSERLADRRHFRYILTTPRRSALKRRASYIWEDRLMRDVRAGGHSFGRSERCSVCGLSREAFDDSGRCCYPHQPSKNRTSRPPLKSERPSAVDWE